MHISIEDLLIPPSTYLYDRRVSEDIFAPYATGRRAFTALNPFPKDSKGQPRLPRVLRETSTFLLQGENVKQEGLFRVPPHAKLRDVLKEAYDRGQKYIIWKDNGETLPLPPYPNAEHQDEIIAELDSRDAYSVFMAAALIKAWYASLRQPIFPPASYRDMKRLHGDPDDLPGLERLTELLSPSSEWSFLPPLSREILIRHLLPLFSAVAAHEEDNKMSAENLAVCIAPALLCGPDQLEDAKMSSIVRRILTEAIDLWDQGLREACNQTKDAFEQSLELPHDDADWEDPLEGKAVGEERKSWDEYQSSGIILQDNEGFQTAEKGSDQPPALPPRMAAVSGRSSGEQITKRKPAPPLQVPPRYSTALAGSPVEGNVSPTTQAATTDGFSPRVAEGQHSSDSKVTQDEKKSGTNLIDFSAPSPIVVPKRKALTTDQIKNADLVDLEIQARKMSVELDAQAEAEVSRPPLTVKERGMALPGLANLIIAKPGAQPPPVKRKAVGSAEQTPSPISTTSSPSNTSPTVVAPAPQFRRPSLPASANRAPAITSLARPVYPHVNPVTNRPPSKSTSLPIPGPKPRTPSAALLQRMPSFETSKKDHLAPPTAPRKLNAKKKSVDDLRRLYEERVGTASALVEAGRKKVGT